MEKQSNQTEKFKSWKIMNHVPILQYTEITKKKIISLETCTKRFAKKICTKSDVPSTMKIITVCSHSNYIFQGQSAELNTLWHKNLCIERCKKSEGNPVQVLKSNVSCPSLHFFCKLEAIARLHVNWGLYEDLLNKILAKTNFVVRDPDPTWYLTPNI